MLLVVCISRCCSSSGPLDLENSPDLCIHHGHLVHICAREFTIGPLSRQDNVRMLMVTFVIGERRGFGTAL